MNVDTQHQLNTYQNNVLQLFLHKNDPIFSATELDSLNNLIICPLYAEKHHTTSHRIQHHQQCLVFIFIPPPVHINGCYVAYVVIRYSNFI